MQDPEGQGHGCWLRNGNPYASHCRYLCSTHVMCALLSLFWEVWMLLGFAIFLKMCFINYFFKTLDRVLYIPVWSQIYYVAEDDFEWPSDPPASASPGLGLQAGDTTPSSYAAIDPAHTGLRACLTSSPPTKLHQQIQLLFLKHQQEACRSF